MTGSPAQRSRSRALPSEVGGFSDGRGTAVAIEIGNRCVLRAVVSLSLDPAMVESGAGNARSETIPPAGSRVRHGLRRTLCVAVAVVSAATVQPLASPVAAQEPLRTDLAVDTLLWRRMLAAEDERGHGVEGVAALREGRRAAAPRLRAWAVRALGRLEADSLLSDILPLLDDADQEVRAQAANAAAQAVVHGDPGRARSALIERARREADARVLGVIAESLGRLGAHDSSTVHETAETLLALSRMAPATAGGRPSRARGSAAPDNRSSPEREETGTEAQENGSSDVTPAQLIGAVRGLYFLVRQPEAQEAPPRSVVLRLVELTTHQRDRASDTAIAAIVKAGGDTAADSAARADTARGVETETPATGAAAAAGAGGDANASTDSVELTERRIRTVATAALVASGAATEEQLAAILADSDPYVRREAAAGAAALDDRSAARRLAERALEDESGVVRFEGLRVLGRIAVDADACARMRAGTSDGSAHVALLAIDLLGTPRCAIRPGVAQLLDREARTLPRPRNAETSAAGGGWHRAAHAIVALATADPARARRRLPAFVEHDDFFVRAYAARAASALGDERTLRRLAADAHPNVRTEAVGALRAYVGHGADSLYIAQLAHDDSQLLQAAADALAGSRDAAAPVALLDALDRVSEARRETSRDARRALLERVAELGRPTHADRLEPYLRDFDPTIAAQAADILEAWTGTRPQIDPTAPPPTPLPALDELNQLAGTRVIIEIAETPAETPQSVPPSGSDGGGTIELRLLPFAAPTNVARFVRLAREGYYDGLTFHRIAPNFVVQGGSPRANEYAGDGPYTRDELGLAGNWRGTVGLSTRGRDTGDAQLYINVIDNVRLDHDYTVWAEVVKGMDVVDRMLEGAVMRSVTVHAEARR